MSQESMPSNLETQEPSSQTGSTRQTAWRLLVGFVIVFAVAAVLGALFQEPIEALGSTVVERYGLVGLSISVVLVDMIPTPLSYVPFMFLAVAGGIPIGTVFLVAGFSSYLAGFTGYGVGRTIGMPARLEGWLQENHPRVRLMLHQRGAWGLAAIALLPLPMAMGSWSAGALKLPLHQVAVALLARFPKTVLYLWMIDTGLHLGAG